MANTGINLTEEILKTKYIVERLSILKISKELNYSPDTIHKQLKKYGLNRNKSEAQKLKCVMEGVHNQFELNLDEIKKLYLDDGLNTFNVADKMGCSQFKVWKTLKSNGLSRNRSETNSSRIISDKTKCKLRLNQISIISVAKFNGGQVFPNYNKSSISFIENYGKNNGYNFKHAENGGEFYIKELGYWVDGYDENKNVVIEFDEKHHDRQLSKDNKRQEEIINHLKCDFIRLNEDGSEKLKIKFYGK